MQTIHRESMDVRGIDGISRGLLQLDAIEQNGSVTGVAMTYFNIDTFQTVVVQMDPDQVREFSRMVDSIMHEVFRAERGQYT